MDLVTLNEDMQPYQLIENYDSLIWTERFDTTGDMQITTGLVDEFMTILPEGTILSLRESNVAMIVETHQIDRKKNKPEVLTIKGRSFESILDRRVALSDVVAGVADWTVTAKTPSDVAYYIIEKICVEGILSVNDIFPPEIVQFNSPLDYETSTGPAKSFSVAKQNLLTAVLALIQTEAMAVSTTTPPTPEIVRHGIQAIRPNADGTAITVDIYTGTDRSASIYFDATRDMLDDGSYLFSKVGSASNAYIIGPASAARMSKTPTMLAGMERRVILVDGTTSGIGDATTLRSYAETGLAEAHETAIFNGTINQEISDYKYGVDYFLGDTVKLVGDYGMEEKARVTEYIRSEDATGSKSYPSLVTIQEF